MSDARLFVIAAPSGAGKTTLVKALVDKNPDLKFSISYTTRRKRRTETDGVDYLFVDQAEFAALKEQGELLESALVFDNHYATSRTQVQQHLDDGHNVILEIDWQGAQQVRESMPECVTIFVLPPSLAELEQRLRDRQTDAPAVIDRRLRDAKNDMTHWDEFDHVIINDVLADAVRELENTLKGSNDATSTDNPDLRRRVEATLHL